MDKNQDNAIAAEPRLEPGKDPIIRLNCLDLASRQFHDSGDPKAVVAAANLFLNFVGGQSDRPPLMARQAQIDAIARMAHEVNRAYCQALGDNTQPHWEDAPDWQRASARMGVELHLSGDFGPEASHESWMRQKLEDGWLFGPEKSEKAKTHPCIVPFAILSREQQAKDFLFRGVVHAMKGGA